jgi:hypothetical protein
MGLSASAFALTVAEIQAERARIETTYKAAVTNCQAMEGNNKDICEKEAQGNRKVAESELVLKAMPSEKARHDARMARADADYEVAKERCDDLNGDAKETCLEDAKALHEKAKENALMRQ